MYYYSNFDPKSFYLIAVFVLILGSLLTFLALKLFPKFHLMDRPERYGLRRSPIPYYGGLVIFLTFFIGVILFVPFSKMVLGLLAGGFVITLLGFFDDFFSLHPFFRLVVQFFAAALLVYFGIFIFSISLPFIGIIDFTSVMWGYVPVLAALFTIFWVMAIVNTMNFVDGIGGLSSGVSFIGGLAIFFLSINPQINANLEAQLPVALMALVLSMTSLAFLFFDFPKPKILMGDSGSTFLGFVLATLAIFSGGKVATAFLVLALPILDMVWVVLRRLFSGQKIWKGDLKHLHHRLMQAGLSELQVTIVYLSLTAVFGFLAVNLVSGQQKFFMLISLVILMIVLAFGLVFLPRKR